MAYDSATRNVVLFGGGAQGPAYNDTWTWDGSTWTRQAPATRPIPRYDAAMAYDAASRNAVLFGGDDNIGNPVLRDTWTWG